MLIPYPGGCRHFTAPLGREKSGYGDIMSGEAVAEFGPCCGSPSRNVPGARAKPLRAAWRRRAISPTL